MALADVMLDVQAKPWTALALSTLHNVVARSLSSVDVKNLPGDRKSVV